MSKYILKKDDRTVTISKDGDQWNYRKEFGSTLIENFDFTEDKLDGLLLESKDVGYKITDSIQNHKEWFSIYIDADGNRKHYKHLLNNSVLHREDGPAVEYTNGNKEWWIDGNLYKTEGTLAGDIKYVKWYKNGYPHKEDGPACEYSNGLKMWFENGVWIKSTSTLPKL